MHLLAITPGRGFHPEAWARVLASGIDALLIREPLEDGALADAAVWCRERAPEVRIWVRGLILPGCGLHLPEGTEPGDQTGLSRPLHQEDQWAMRKDAAQLLLSPILPTPGKGEPWGMIRLHRFLDGLPEGGPRLLALGGIRPEDVPGIRHPRLDGIAAIRPFWDGDPAAAVRKFRKA